MKKILLNTVQKTSPNHKAYYALVDKRDFNRLIKFNWHILRSKQNIYAFSHINKNHVPMHRFILNTNSEIDHINNNGLDNRRKNIRIVTRSQNNANTRKRCDCSSIHKGVSFFRATKKWHGYINKDGKRIHLGYYENEVDAAIAYNKKAKELFGKYAKLNQI